MGGYPFLVHTAITPSSIKMQEQEVSRDLYRGFGLAAVYFPKQIRSSCRSCSPEMAPDPSVNLFSAGPFVTVE